MILKNDIQSENHGFNSKHPPWDRADLEGLVCRPRPAKDS